ncbi:MAG: glycosyltransferase, partial [Myxococcales bacterium]
RAVLALLRRLDRERFRFSVAAIGGDGALESRVRELGVEVHALGADAGRYRALLADRAVDLVASIGSTFGLPFTSEAGVAHLHVFDSGAAIHLDSSKATAPLLRELERVVAISPTVADIARRRYRIRPERLQIVPAGVEVEGVGAAKASARAEARRSLDIADDALVFLTLGDFEVGTGHLLAIAAFERVLQRHAKAFLICAGDATVESRESRVESLGVAGSRPAVRIERLDASSTTEALFAASDFFVQPVGIDGLRRRTLEAVARGMPLVAPNGPDVRDLLGEPASGVVFNERVNWARRKKALAALREPSAEAISMLANAMGRACREAEALKSAAASGVGRSVVENAYALEAIARLFEGDFLGTWSA